MIERYQPEITRKLSGSSASMEPNPGGDFVRYEDHLEALAVSFEITAHTLAVLSEVFLKFSKQVKESKTPPPVSL